jgi:hypothetical protein
MSHIKLPIVITPSRVDGALKCHRKHVLQDVLSKAAYYSPSLEFGSVIHAGVNNYWLARKFNKIPTWEAAIEKEWHERFELRPQVSTKSVSLAMAKGMMQGYAESASLGGELFTDGYELMDCEQRFEIPIPLDDHHALLSFQCDRVLYEKNNRNHIVIVDTKTASRLDARWERQWETSIQMRLYKLAAMELFQTDQVDILIEGVLKHVPTVVKYHSPPDWSKLQLAEALHAAKSIAIRDENLIVAQVGHQAMDKNEPILRLRTQAELEEIAVKFTIPNYGECFSYNIECSFWKICSADFPDRLDILHSGEYFDLPQNEETY